jgi:hypothetical protein
MGCASSSEYTPTKEDVKDFMALVSSTPSKVKLQPKVFKYFQMDRCRVEDIINDRDYDTGQAEKEQVISYLYSLDRKNGSYHVNDERMKECTGYSYTTIANVWYLRRAGSGTRLKPKTEEEIAAQNPSIPTVNNGQYVPYGQPSPYGQPIQPSPYGQPSQLPPHMRQQPPHMRQHSAQVGYGQHQSYNGNGNGNGNGNTIPSAPPLHY